MGDKRYDIVCKSARRRIQGIDCILGMIDSGSDFHDSVIERFDLDTVNEVLIVDIGDVWAAEQEPAGRYRFIFKGYMEIDLDYDTGNSFTYELHIYKEHRGDLLAVEFNSLHLKVVCSDISVEENPYTDEELERFK